jgi:hypothetical protein
VLGARCHKQRVPRISQKLHRYTVRTSDQDVKRFAVREVGTP